MAVHAPQRSISKLHIEGRKSFLEIMKPQLLGRPELEIPSKLLNMLLKKVDG